MKQGFLYGGLCVVMGVFMLFLTFMTDNGKVMCGSSEMEPGDTCQVMEEGGAERSYEEQKAKNSSQNTWMLVLGPLMIIGGAIWFGSSVRMASKLSKAKKQAAQSYMQQPQQGYGQAPQNYPGR